MRLTSGYIQALIAGVVEAPRQDVDALSRSNGCCGTIKPHGLDAIRALDEALGYLEDGAQDGSDDKADCDATLEYIGSRAGAIVDRLYSDRSLLRNVVRSNHHGKEYTRRACPAWTPVLTAQPSAGSSARSTRSAASTRVWLNRVRAS